MGLDELNELGKLGVDRLLGIAVILAMLGFILYQRREAASERLEHAERQQEAETERLRLEERKLYMSWLGEMTKAAAETGNYIKELSEQQRSSFAAASRSMSESAARRDVKYQEGVDNIRADVGEVPDKVGKVMEPPIDTLRKALEELEARVGKRIDESVDKFTAENQAIIRAEIEALTNHLLQKLDELTEVVPERVVKLIPNGAQTSGRLDATQHALVASEQANMVLADRVDELTTSHSAEAAADAGEAPQAAEQE